MIWFAGFYFAIGLLCVGFTIYQTMRSGRYDGVEIALLCAGMLYLWPVPVVADIRAAMKQKAWEKEKRRIWEEQRKGAA